MKPKIYFGHPINFYNIPKEKELIQIIKEHFPEYEIENPNQKHHAENYQQWKIEKGDGMLYFIQEVLPQMASGIFLPFEDHMFGLGVFKEARFFYRKGIDAYEINFKGEINNLVFHEARCLSLKETRKRVYGK